MVIQMDLKELLGEDLYTQVAEKVGEHKIAIVSDGSWIPKTKFDEKNTELKDLKGQLSERDKQLKDLQTKATGNESLQAEITRLQQENEQAREKYEQELQQREYDFVLESALRDAKAKNPKAVRALLNTDAIKLADGKLVGLDEQLKSLRESDDYLFVPDGLKGKTPPGTPPSVDKLTMTKEQFSQLGYSEKVKLYNENPELYKQLSN